MSPLNVRTDAILNFMHYENATHGLMGRESLRGCHTVKRTGIIILGILSIFYWKQYVEKIIFEKLNVRLFKSLIIVFINVTQKCKKRAVK